MKATPLLQPQETNFCPSGYSDAELEYLCGVTNGKYSEVHPLISERKPSVYFMGQINGYGTALRSILNLPNWYPLPFSLDHGVSFASELSPFEKNKASSHFVWDQDRYEALRKKYGSRIKRIRNPIISMIEQEAIRKSSDATGTIVFLPHSNDTCKLGVYDWDDYMSQIDQKFSNLGRIVLCLHPHDIKEQRHKYFRKFGKPLITFGNNTSDMFIKKFISTVSQFQYGTSIVPGSEAYYCSSLGVDYMQFGTQISKKFAPNTVAENLKDELVVKYFSERDLYFAEELRGSGDSRQFISKKMGLDVTLEDSKAALKAALIRDSFILSIPIVTIIFKTILKKILGRGT